MRSVLEGPEQLMPQSLCGCCLHVHHLMHSLDLDISRLLTPVAPLLHPNCTPVAPLLYLGGGGQMGEDGGKGEGGALGKVVHALGQ